MIMECLRRGNTLIIFDGLDEIPLHLNRADLIQEINALLERSIEYDAKLNRLCFSDHEEKEICATLEDDLDAGNRFIITSRLEGNYYDEINTHIPRLTIEDMSDEALRDFCDSYMECIHTHEMSSKKTPQFVKEELYRAIKKSDHISKLAVNPQVASVIATVYSQSENTLPDKRIDLYEKAIERMLERLIHAFSAKVSTKSFTLDKRTLWSIMQEIAEYLHERTEGLTEAKLKEIVSPLLSNSACQNTEIT